MYHIARLPKIEGCR